MSSRGRSINKKLTSNGLELAVKGRYRRTALLLLLLVVLGGVAATHYFRKHIELIRQTPQLMQENDSLHTSVKQLSDELEQIKLNQEIESITRQELERQLAVLNEQLKKTTAELEFFKSTNSTRP